MRPIASSGAGRRALAEILGAQIAWWSLGFRVRRAVVREARRGNRFPDPDVAEVAAGWAGQWLAAPRWWRLVRGAGVTAVLVLCLAGLVIVLFEVDQRVALSGAVTGCLPLAAGWSWRQARNAGALLDRFAEPGTGSARPRGLAVRAAVVLLAVTAAVGAMATAIANERAARYACPSFAVDAPVRDWWLRAGGRVGVGCPAGDSRPGPGGLRYTPWNPYPDNEFHPNQVAYVPPSAGPMVMPLDIFTAWTAAGGPSGALGQPTDGDSNEPTAFMNFLGGAITLSSDRLPTVHLGRRFSTARGLASACPSHDSPCIRTAFADRDGIHVSWQYGAADAFNVSWTPDGGPPGSGRSREVAGSEITFTGVPPASGYVVGVQACDKHFLRRSTCTWPPDRVIVRVG